SLRSSRLVSRAMRCNSEKRRSDLDRRFLCSTLCPRASPLIDLARIEGIAETVAHVVDGQHREEDQGTGEQRLMRVQLEVVLRREEHLAPGGNVGREAESKER